MRSFISRNQPLLISLLFLTAFILIINSYAEFDTEEKEKDIRDNLLELLISKKAQLEKSLYSRIYYTKGVAAYCSINPEINYQDFNKLAAELVKNDSVISSMSLAKNCVINAIYPYKGHESAIGLNLLEHPARKRIVESTIHTQKTFVAGPVELVEGGLAFISYTPIFTKKNGSLNFWGVTDIVILKDMLFNEIKLTPSDKNFNYAIRGIDGQGFKGECFFGDSTIFEKDPVLTEIYLPAGTWIIAAVPVQGWQNSAQKNEIILLILYLSAFIISILIWLLVKAFLKIKANEKELKAMFGAMHDIVIQLNSKGEYVKIAPTNEKLLVKPSKELLNKTLFDIFDGKTAKYFMDAVQQCLSTKNMVVLNYPLSIQQKTLWFQARISYLSDDAVIYVAQDYTAQKVAEDELKESRQQLIELNATKDKFFSIIAHDLKGPFLGFLGISEELKNNNALLTREEITELAELLHSSAKKTYNLLNNLLDWSRLQTGKMELVPELLDLKMETELCINLFESAAAMKSIEIQNNIIMGIYISADKNMLNTVLRNLISNAIKFSKTGGKIKISSQVLNGSIILSIQDNGIGMTQDVIEKVFRIDSGYSTKGTSGEEGTGLGLVLCKELIIKNQGKINILSEPGTGTTINIDFPRQ